MIVRFHFEDGGEAVANVHDAGIFAGTLQHLRRARGEAPEMHAAGFIGAMLAPHHAENSEFGEIGFAAENVPDARVFLGRDAVFGDDFGRYLDRGFDDFGRARRVRQASAHGSRGLPRERLHERSEADQPVG